jgi:formylglycine-generating enzyme required for sulfatase activity
MSHSGRVAEAKRVRRDATGNRVRRVLLVVVAALVLAGGIFAVRLALHQSEETAHYQLEEMKLVVTNLAAGHKQLFRAGKSLDDARELAIAGDVMWLPRGNYFLRIDLPDGPAFYPVPVTGYRDGPDEGGSLIVTVRTPVSGSPNRLIDWLPPVVHVASGQFLFGERLNLQEPHYVWLPGYYIAPFEVTNTEFKEFMVDPSGYRQSANWTEEGIRWKASTPSRASARLTSSDDDFGRFGQPDQPVTNVSWYEANAFCRWMTRRLGGGKWIFALPSEAEWEKAARGPDGFDYGLGNSVSDDQVTLYNWKKNPGAEFTVAGWNQTRTQYKPNRYGMYHASGNVAEWTQSVSRTFNRQRPFVDDDRNHDETSGQRVVRGGSWYTASVAVLSLAYRETFQPSVTAPYLGFRILARPLP